MNWTKSVNEDVQQNILAGIKAGLLIPKIKYRNKLSKEEDFETYYSKDWTMIGPIYVEDIRGPKVTINGLWDGEQIHYPTMMMNFRGLLNNDQGMLLDSNAITVFENRSGFGIDLLYRFGKYISEHENYTGWMSLDCIIKPDVSQPRSYYNYVRVGIPVDFCVALEELYGVPYEAFESHDVLQPVDNFATVLKLYTFPDTPYDSKDIEDIITGLPAKWTGESWVMSGRSNKVNKAWANLYEQIPSHLSRMGLCYRTDGLTVSKKNFEELQKSGVL